MQGTSLAARLPADVHALIAHFLGPCGRFVVCKAFNDATRPVLERFRLRLSCIGKHIQDWCPGLWKENGHPQSINDFNKALLDLPIRMPSAARPGPGNKLIREIVVHLNADSSIILQVLLADPEKGVETVNMLKRWQRRLAEGDAILKTLKTNKKRRYQA